MSTADSREWPVIVGVDGSKKALASILRAACSYGVEPVPSGLWG